MRQSLLKTSLLLAAGFLPGLVQAQETANGKDGCEQLIERTHRGRFPRGERFTLFDFHF